MPRTRRAKPLYQRGAFRLYPRPGRNHEVIWYDGKRERSTSAGTSDLEAGRIAVDRLYLAKHGGAATCPTCGQAVEQGKRFVAGIMSDYLISHAPQTQSSEAICARLAHVTRYISTLPNAGVEPHHVTEAWIRAFRKWLSEEPYIVGSSERLRAPATVENSVVQLAAALAWAKQDVLFEPISLKDLTNSPSYRADVETLAAMFRYALKGGRRASLLAFLRLGVMTWARPDAIMDASTDPKRNQWHSQARVFALNPVGRKQTRNSERPYQSLNAPHGGSIRPTARWFRKRCPKRRGAGWRRH